MKKLILITTILLAAIMLPGQIINIPADYPTIQQGIDAANEGDTVLVQPGTYFEHVYICCKSLTLASLYLTSHDTSYISQTTIDGNNEATVVYIENYMDITKEYNIIGFTIQNGKAYSLWPECGGGGISICNLGGEMSELNLQNLIIKNNVCHDNSRSGGGIYIGALGGAGLYYGIIKDVSIINNYANHGGGIYCENFNGSLQNVTIDNNQGFSSGGGGYFLNSNPTLQNVVITSDSSNSWWHPHAGGLYFENSNPVLQNVVLSKNSPNGIECYHSNVIITNATITENRPVGLGSTFSNVSIANSIFWENNYNEPWSNHYQIIASDSDSVSISYSDIEYGIDGILCYNLNWLEGNINEDPLFEGSGEYPHQLSAGSPCIDTGTPDTTGLNLPFNDLMGNSRFWDGDENGDTIVDMGAYEFGSVGVGINKPIVQNADFEMVCFPNPFSDDITFEFDLPRATTVLIQVFNTMGVKVADFPAKFLPSGLTQLDWNSGSLPIGIYFSRLQIGNETITRKIIKVQ